MIADSLCLIGETLWICLSNALFLRLVTGNICGVFKRFVEHIEIDFAERKERVF